MATKKLKQPTFTAQLRCVLVVDVEVEGGDLEGAIGVAKTWKTPDLLKFDDAVSLTDSKFDVVGVWSDQAWSTE
jgi:hypothetical protein